jgi:hypothetical protein
MNCACLATLHFERLACFECVIRAPSGSLTFEKWCDYRTVINLSSELFASIKRLFKSVIAVIVIFNQLRCVFIRTLSVEGVASEFSRSLLLGSPRSLLVFFFSFFPGIFLRERSRPVFFVFAVSFSSFLGRPKLLLVFRRFYVVGCVIAITVDAFWGDFVSQLTVPGEMVPGTFYAFSPCVTVDGCVPSSLTPVTLHEDFVINVTLPAYLSV